jgi:hypothetical protein
MPQAMATEIQKHCETIEECYEFTLSYAARGLTNEEGTELRAHLTRAASAMRGLERSCAETVTQLLAPAGKYEAFFNLLKRDAESALAAMELVLAQPTIGSQLIDNLNASIHLRALLADLFLITEILNAQQTKARAAQG